MKTHIEGDAVEDIVESLRRFYTGGKPAIICVGTDRSTGDALAPLVGKMLEERFSPADNGYLLYGTIDDPIHGSNLERVRDIPENTWQVGIDAGLGEESSVGCIIVKNESLHPGTGVDKTLPEVGNSRIVGIVNVSGVANTLILGSTRLSVVFNMAETIYLAVKKFIHGVNQF